jgi:hypothetical protein
VLLHDRGNQDVRIQEYFHFCFRVSSSLAALIRQALAAGLAEQGRARPRSPDCSAPCFGKLDG